MRRILDFTVIQTAALTAVAACASVGLIFLLVDGPPPASPVFTIPVTAAGLTVLLMLIERTSLARGYENGMTDAYIDAATRLPTPRVAHQFLALEFAAAERGQTLTLVFFGIENYRRLAVLHGPDEMSRLLLGVGAILKRRTRGMNLSARFDENGTFVSVMGGVSTEGACTFVHRVRKDFATLKVADQPIVVTVGMCAYEPWMHTADELVEETRKSLDNARKNGGNRVVVSGEITEDDEVVYEIA